MRYAIFAIALMAGAVGLAAQQIEASPPVRVVEFTDEEAKEAIRLLELALKANGFLVDRQARAIAEKIGKAPIKDAKSPVPPADKTTTK